MNIPIKKITGIILTLLVLSLSGCAVFVGDGRGHYHHGYWRHHSSIPQSNPSTVQMTAQTSAEAQGHDPVGR